MGHEPPAFRVAVKGFYFQSKASIKNYKIVFWDIAAELTSLCGLIWEHYKATFMVFY